MEVAGRFHIRRLPDSGVDESLDAELRALLSACFTKPCDVVFQTRRYFTEMPRYRWIARSGEALTGHVAGHDKMFATDRGAIHVLGVAEVCVAPDSRRHGLARMLLAMAHEWARQQGFGFAVLFGAARHYSSSGYQPVANVLRVTQPDGAIVERVHAEAMYRPLGELPWPTGVIDLRGPVF